MCVCTHACVPHHTHTHTHMSEDNFEENWFSIAWVPGIRKVQVVWLWSKYLYLLSQVACPYNRILNGVGTFEPQQYFNLTLVPLRSQCSHQDGRGREGYLRLHRVSWNACTPACISREWSLLSVSSHYPACDSIVPSAGSLVSSIIVFLLVTE